VELVFEPGGDGGQGRPAVPDVDSRGDGEDRRLANLQRARASAPEEDARRERREGWWR